MVNLNIDQLDYFPHKTLIRKELKIDDLVFVEE